MSRSVKAYIVKLLRDKGLTQSQAAFRLNVTETTLEKWIKEGKIPVYKFQAFSDLVRVSWTELHANNVVCDYDDSLGSRTGRASLWSIVCDDVLDENDR
jgi:excisionase family DNA binding protein